MTTSKKRVIRNARVALVHCRPYWAAIGLIEPEEQVGAGHYLLFGQNITRDIKAHVRCLKQCFCRPAATVPGQCRANYGDFLLGPASLGLRMA
jgi:hypothetical protein